MRVKIVLARQGICRTQRGRANRKSFEAEVTDADFYS
jgi:hypothetical protein